MCVPAHRIYDLKFRIEVGRFRAQGAAKLRQRGSSSRKENEKQFSILLENKGKATTKLNDMKRKKTHGDDNDNSYGCNFFLLLLLRIVFRVDELRHRNKMSETNHTQKKGGGAGHHSKKTIDA